MIVKIDNDTYETSIGNVYSYKAVKNTMYSLEDKGFKIKEPFIEYAVCINFNYDKSEIEFYDRYYIVIGKYTSKRFCKKDKAEKWKNEMEEKTGTEFIIHEVTQENFMKNMNNL